MAEDWKEANLKRIRDFDAVEKAKKTVANYNPKEPNKPEWKRKNEDLIKAFDAKEKARKAKAKTSVMVALPKSTTPNMDTTKGTTGSRNSFDAGEVNPFAPRAAAEKLIDYPSRTADAPTPAEVAASSTSDRSTWEDPMDQARRSMGFKKGGKVKCMSSGGSSKASSRGDGCAQRGKTRGRMI